MSNNSNFSIDVVNWLGTDLSVVNAARVSFLKESKVLSPQDKKLIKFLVAHGHWSCFRHAFLSFRIKSDLVTRIFWQETTRDLAGHYFSPSLSSQIVNVEDNEQGQPVYVGLKNSDIIEWNWTVSLQGIKQFYDKYSKFSEKIDRFYIEEVIKHTSLYFPECSKYLFDESDHIYFSKISERPVFEVPDLKENVLDKGYVRLTDYMKANSEDETIFSFEIKAPLFVVRQFFKYVRSADISPLGLIQNIYDEEGFGNGDDGAFGDWAYGRSESSRRYVTLPAEFYVPEWRASPENKKQGSGEKLDNVVSQFHTEFYQNCVVESNIRYEKCIEDGVAPEQARMYLLAYGMYISYRWTCSGTALQFLLSQRLKNDAQWETQEFARALDKILHYC